MTPGRPTALCTTSMFLLALTAGVTVQLPRMFCSTAAAAPGCPSIAEYCAACANRPNKIITASRPRSTPRGMRNAASPVSNPTTTRITRTPRPLPMMIGMAFGLDLRISPATARICFSRPAFARFSAVSLVTAGSAAPAFLDMRAMLRSIRLSRPGQKPPGFGDFRVTPYRPASPDALAACVPCRPLPCRAGTGSLRDGLGVQPPGPVGGPHQRSGHHAREPEFGRLLAQFHELFGLDPALHRMVPRGRPEVLGDGQQVTACHAQVLHGLGDLVPLLAQPQDQVGLGDQPSVAGRAQHVERARVPEAGPDPAEDPRHGLDVVREDFRPGTEDLGQSVRLGVEVGNEQFHAATWDGGVDLAADLRVQPRTAVGQVVTRDTGHGRVLQAHGGDGLRDPAWLARVERQRLARVDLAEVTPPGALVATDEE